MQRLDAHYKAVTGATEASAQISHIWDIVHEGGFSFAGEMV